MSTLEEVIMKMTALDMLVVVMQGVALSMIKRGGGKPQPRGRLEVVPVNEEEVREKGIDVEQALSHAYRQTPSTRGC
jgi:hypothetical protein